MEEQARGGRARVVLLGTFDTKAEEHSFLRDKLLALAPSWEVIAVNCGAMGSTSRFPVSYEASELAKAVGEDLAQLRSDRDRGKAMTVMAEGAAAFVRQLCQQRPFHAIVGCGGSGGSSVVCAAMRALPFSVVKVCLSTLASGDVSSYVQGSNIIMVPSIVDVAGLNRILRVQFSATAAMVVGMVNETLATQTERNIPSKPVIVASMFGNTTTCVRNAQKLLEEKYGYEVLVFHSVGTGGKAMESILDSVGCDVAGVLDITTTEWADELCGGVMSAGPERLSRPGQLAIPHLIAPGCLDMVNFGPFATVPEKYRTDERRCFYEWNSAVTLMRTNKEENVTLGKILAEKAKAAKGPVAFLLPKKGISILDGDGERFCDREADEALFSSLKENLSDSSANIRIHEVDCNINDEQFSTHAVELLLQLIEGNKNSEKLKEYSTPESKALVSPTLVPSSSLSLPPGLEGDDSLRGRTLKRLWNECIIKRKPIIGAGAGTGISAKFEEAGGADMIIIYNSGRFRMGGRSSLSGLMPYKDANKIVMEMASEEKILTVVKDVPVLAGVCGTDPFRDMDRFLRKIKKRGFAGVQNFPTVGLIDGTFRQNLEETGITFKQEVEMIRKARQLGLVTTPYAFNPEDARMMAEAGADIIVAHMGLTTKGSIGASTALTLDESVRLTQEICDAAKEVNPFVIVLCHGGPISMPEDAEYVLRRTNGVHGFYGASSVERLPTEQAITNQLRAFKALSFA